MTDDLSFLSWLESDEFKKQVDDALDKPFQGVEKYLERHDLRRHRGGLASDCRAD